MNTSTNINQVHDITTSTVGDTGIEFLRRNVASALLAMAFAATGIGFAATAHADEPPQPPATDAPAAIAPAPIGPWLPAFGVFGDRRWAYSCGFRNWQGPFQCW